MPSSEPLLEAHAVTDGTAQETQAPARTSLWSRAFHSLLARAPTNGARVAESLDYEPIQNRLYFERLKQRKSKRHVYGYSGLTLAKNLVVILTGALTGLVGVIMGRSVKYLVEWRNETLQHMISEAGHPAPAFIFNMMYGMSLTLFAACMVTFWAPSAAGAGVTLVMAYLNGNHIPNLLRARTLVTKIFGAIAGVASGLAIGPEGPMVHIGACIASNITYANCRAMTWLWPWASCNKGVPSGDDGDEGDTGSEHNASTGRTRCRPICATWEELHEDSEHREFISAGASAGLSAAFGAPIGGVLFSMEEACSFWSKKVAWRCFVAAMLAAFTISQLSEGGDRGVIVFAGMRTLSNVDWIHQFPLMVLIAGLGGLLGAIFNMLRRLLWKVRASRSRKFLRVLEALAIAFACCGLAFGAVHYLGVCEDVPKSWPEDFKGVRWRCPPDQHNDIATLAWAVPDDVLGRIFSVGHDISGHEVHGHGHDVSGFTQRTLIVWTVIYMIMMAIGAGICVPAGLFMPSISLGATAGLSAGLWMQQQLPASWHIQPGMYALICATAVLAGVFRSAISLVVLVVEGTRGINFLFGVIIAVIVANFMASFLEHDGVYESEIERDGNVFFLRHEPPHKLATMTAGEIMVPNPVCFPQLVQVKEVLRVLRQTTHHGFPVVESAEDLHQHSASGGDDGVAQLEGLVLRSQLLVLLRERAFSDQDGNPVQPETHYEARQHAIERRMRLFYRRAYTHHRYMATRDPLIASLDRSITRSERQRYAKMEEGEAGAGPPRQSTSRHTLPSITEAGEGGDGKNGSDQKKRGGRNGSSNGASGEVPTMSDINTSAFSGSTNGANGQGGESVFDRDLHIDDAVEVGTNTNLHDAQDFDRRREEEEEELLAILDSVSSASNLYLDLRPYMNTAPLTVRREMSAARVHRTFVTLGMRHLCVVNSRNRVVGIITRKDLDLAATHGPIAHVQLSARNLSSSHSVIATTSRAALRARSAFGGSEGGRLSGAGAVLASVVSEGGTDYGVMETTRLGRVAFAAPPGEAVSRQESHGNSGL